MIHIDIGINGCSANCSHCPAALVRNNGEEQNRIVGMVTNMVDQYLSLGTGGEVIELEFISPAESLVPELLQIIPSRVRGCVNRVGLWVDSEAPFQNQQGKLGEAIDVLEPYYANMPRWDIGFFRNLSSLENQMSRMPEVLEWSVSLSELQRLSIIGGSNELPPSSVEQVANSIRVFLEGLSQSCIDIGGTWGEVKEESESDIFLSREFTNGSGVERFPYFVLWGPSMETKPSWESVLHTVRSHRSDMLHSVFFGSEQQGVNLVHHPSTTRFPGIWASYEQYKKILDRAEALGSYRDAVLEYLLSVQSSP